MRVSFLHGAVHGWQATCLRSQSDMNLQICYGYATGSEHNSWCTSKYATDIMFHFNRWKQTDLSGIQTRIILQISKELLVTYMFPVFILKGINKCTDIKDTVLSVLRIGTSQFVTNDLPTRISPWWRHWRGRWGRQQKQTNIEKLIDRPSNGEIAFLFLIYPFDFLLNYFM